MIKKPHQMILLLPIVFGIQLSVISASTSANAEEWTLSRILARARESSPVLRSAESEVAVAEGQAHQAGRWDNPEISVSGGPMTISVLKGYTYEASLKQTIPLFGKKSRAAAVERQGLTIAENDFSSTRLSFQHEIARAAYELLAAEMHSQYVTHRREHINLIGQYLSSRPFASPAQAVEKTLIQNRIREIEEKYFEAATNKTKKWQELNVNLQLKDEITPALPWFENISLPNEADIRATILAQHPELRRQKLVAEQSSLAVSFANSKSYPDIKIGGGYNYQSIELPQKQYVGTIEFTLPIWDAGGGAQKAAEAKRVAEEGRLDLAQRHASSELEQAWSELITSKKKVDTYPLKLIKSLETEMRRAEANWKKGLVPATAYLELESQVHEQADRVYEAQVSYVNALSHILFLSGREFSTEVK